MPLSNDAWIIRTLWIGPELSTIEQLCIKSFLANGHRVELFTYGDVRNIPAGTVVRDGNDILGEDKVFLYRGHRTYAGFANWFRYLMLYKEGGVWVDIDIVCLKPFNFDTDFFVGLELPDRVNCAVIGTKPGKELMEFLANQAENPNRWLPYDGIREKRQKLRRRFLEGNQRGNIKWGETGPKGLTKALKYFDLFHTALPVNAFYPIDIKKWMTVFDGSLADVSLSFPGSYAIHLWNNMMCSDPEFSKDGSFPENSIIEQLKRRYL
jgi:hypothetical protein